MNPGRKIMLVGCANIDNPKNIPPNNAKYIPAFLLGGIEKK
jgi:hypothetical protein